MCIDTYICTYVCIRIYVIIYVYTPRILPPCLAHHTHAHTNTHTHAHTHTSFSTNSSTVSSEQGRLMVVRNSRLFCSAILPGCVSSIAKALAFTPNPAQKKGGKKQTHHNYGARLTYADSTQRWPCELCVQKTTTAKQRQKRNRTKQRCHNCLEVHR